MSVGHVDETLWKLLHDYDKVQDKLQDITECHAYFNPFNSLSIIYILFRNQTNYLTTLKCKY